MPELARVHTRVNTRAFAAALRAYARVSKSEIPDIINRKAFFIARRACRETKRADPKEIRALRERAIIGTGTKYSKGVGKSFTLRTSIWSTKAAQILVGRAVKKGEEVPSKSEIRQQVHKFISARLRSRAYLASGWLPAIKALAAVVKRKGGAPSPGQANTFGRPKGSAKVATGGFRARAIIENATGVPGKFSQSQPKALEKFGRPALERAVAAETAGTLAEIARRLKSAARSVGIRAQ